MTEELDDQKVAETTEVETDETPAVETAEPSYTEILKKYQLEKRWKADDPIELIDEMGRSYVNAETALRDRERRLDQKEAEAAEMRRILFEQTRSNTQPENPNETDEIKLAKKFVREEAEQLLNPIRQENEMLKARIYTIDRMNHPAETSFKQAVESGELSWAMQQLGLPLTEQNLDRGFKELMYYKTQQGQAQAIQQAKESGAEGERQKASAFVETGGKPKRQATLPSEDVIRKETIGMSEAQFDAYLAKFGQKI